MAIRGNLAFAMLVLAGIVVLGNMPVASAQCGGNFSAIFEKCGEFIQLQGERIPPSQACCDELKNQNIDSECACQYIASRPPGIEERNQISLDKAAYVTRACGIPLGSGIQCGDFVIPPAPAPAPGAGPEE